MTNPQGKDQLKRALLALRTLRRGPVSTGDLAQALGVSRRAVQRLLELLRGEKVGLRTRKEGRLRLHYVVDEWEE
jgi:predicted ArsR family transcriptional regulator